MSELAYIIVPLAAWIAAQLIKQLIALAKGAKEGTGSFFQSGKMPSGHAAGLAALLMVLSVHEGLGSGVFGVAAVMTAIVLYDAVHVRRAVGEHGRVLRTLTKGESFYTADGHRVIEVAAGLLLGVLVAVGLLQIL